METVWFGFVLFVNIKGKDYNEILVSHSQRMEFKDLFSTSKYSIYSFISLY